tara:strand:- start:45 stop:1133 length:1089 start_codon:yes stop_codon:yes gene_type:complete
MAYTTIDDSKLFFNTINYSGTGSSNAITGVGFAPDMVWLKTTSNGQKPCVFDTVRGVDECIFPSEDTAETDFSGTGLTVFGSDGFTVVSDTDVNGSGMAFSSWNWKGGTTTGKPTVGETITPSGYSYSATSGVGMYKYTGTGSNGAIAHGLNSAPEVVMVKRLDVAGNWMVGGKFQDEGASGDYYMNLNTSSANVSNATVWNSTLPSSTLIYQGTYAANNYAASTYGMYAFAPVKGFSQFGTYTGNGNADGSFVHTGFEPELIIAKNRDSGGPASYGWTMIGNTFGMGGSTSSNPSYNELTLSLFADQLTVAATGNPVDFLSNGFKWRGTGVASNQSTSPFIYMAFARNPFTNSSGIPGNAR